MCISFDLTYNPVLSTYSLPRLASPVPSVSDGTVLVWTPCWVPMEWTHRLTAYPVRTPYQGEKVLVRQCLVVSAISFHKLLTNSVTTILYYTQQYVLSISRVRSIIWYVSQTTNQLYDLWFLIIHNIM